ncbi:MAG TPA: glycosyltransferase [Verrucomicrobiae bacterium]|nr:glycosyltransferase [Verrucomicrobiae bacterium]
MNSSGEPLRILHLNSLLTGGGTDDQCVKLAGELHKMGQRVWLAGPSGRRFAPVIGELGVPFFDTGAKPGKFQFIRRAAGLIRRENIQIVHGHHGRDIWPTILAARLAGTKPKIVLTRHMAKSPSSWASRNFLLRQCDALIAVSEFVSKVLREGAYEPQSPEAERHVRPPIRGDYSKIHVIYGGIDTSKFFPADASGKRRELGLEAGEYAFAVAGGFDLPRGKGQREFLAAAARIHKEIPQARFLIIGRGSMAEVLTDDIERLGLRGKARLTGQVADMPQVMNAIDCLVHPQIGTEALGLVICEAHACGKPVIASALDGIPEAFNPGSYGRLVRPEDVTELADAMRSQATQPKADAKQTAQLHRRVAENFSIATMAEKTARLYAGLFG